MNELVSIVVPIYNVEQYLDRCIVSLVYQSYENIEILLIDDGSPDNCPAICDEWKEKDRRIKVVHKQNGGLSDARNEGLRHAVGEYVMFVDSDDWISLIMVEKMVEAIQKYQADLVVCQFVKVTSDGFCYRSFKQEKEAQVLNTVEAIKLLLKDWQITNHSWRYLHKRENIPDDIFPVGKNFEDIFTTYLLFMKCKTVVSLDAAYYFYRQNEQGILKSKRLSDYRACLEAVEKRREDLMESYPLLADAVKESEMSAVMGIWDGIFHRFRKDKIGKEEKRELAYIKREIRNLLKRNKKNLKYFLQQRKLIKAILIIYCPSFERIVYLYIIVLLKKAFRGLRKYKNTVAFYGKYKKIDEPRFFVLSAPNYGNLGDQAILYAEDKFAEQYFPQYHICHIPAYYLSRLGLGCLKRVLRNEDCVVIQAGGNMGTLYHWFHKPQENAILALRKRKVVIMPQTYFYDDTKQGINVLRKSAEVYGKAGNVIVTLRERFSYEFVKNHFKSTYSCLMPDMVLYLKSYCTEERRSRKVYVCLRGDSEKCVDLSEYETILSTVKARGLQVEDIDTHLYWDPEEKAARDELLKFWDKINSAEMMITDRLHGMLFAALTETPCVVLRSRSYKIEGVYEWIKHLNYVSLIDDVSELKGAIEDVLSVEASRYDIGYLEKYWDRLAALIMN